jgi:hypothetical protein
MPPEYSIPCERIPGSGRSVSAPSIPCNHLGQTLDTTLRRGGSFASVQDDITASSSAGVLPGVIERQVA